MKVVILCGGFGTRIRDVNDNIPKPMLPIGQYPILWHIMKYYSMFGMNDFVLALGYRGEVIREFFTNYRQNTEDFTISLYPPFNKVFHGVSEEVNWNVTLAGTGLTAMTGARIKRIRKYVGDSTFCLTYGDGVGNINIDRLLSFHRSHGKILTVTGVRPPGRFGELSVTDGVVNQFNEKPQAEGGRISGGYFVAEPEIFDYISDDDSEIFEQKPVLSLVKEGQLMMYEHNGFWQPMDTSREYNLLNDLYRKGTAPWKIW